VRRLPLVIGIAILGLDAYFLAGVSLLLFRAGRLALAGETAPGQVVGMMPVHIRRTSLYPIISFKTAAGEERRFTSQMAGAGAPEMGDAVSVRYDPRRPAEAAIDSFGALWGPGLAALFGVVLLAVPGVLLVGAARPRKRGSAPGPPRGAGT
jgi:hypothetical protein